MNLQLERKILLLAMAVCIAFPVILTGLLVTDCLGHDCTEPDCPICQKIEMAEIFLKNLKLAGIVLFFTGCFVFLVQVIKAYAVYDAYILSPIALKVRFIS
jgi:hypothetical protein